MTYVNDSIITQKLKDNKKAFAVLVDPDKSDNQHLKSLVDLAENVRVDFFFIGGSLLTKDNFDSVVEFLKVRSNIPVILFPGNNMQLSAHADALLFLSLISGRNPELLIGQHVVAAPIIRKLGIQTIPTGYMLIDGGRPSSVSYMSHTIPIPSDKYDIAASTALAGEMIGQRVIYMDAGSGAARPVHPGMIKKVRSTVNIPIIVGGGISTPEQAEVCCKSGADIIVVGNAIEKDPMLISDLSIVIHSSPTVQ